MEFTIEMKIAVSEETIEDIIEMAGYGISYWARRGIVDDNIYTVVDEYGSKFELTYDDIVNGIKLYVENGNEPYNILDGNEIDSAEIDAEVADMIIQYACFGEIIYG